jgi:hypothetical protein
MKPESNVIDFASLARARKVRFIIQALSAWCREYQPKSEASLLAVAKSLTPDGRAIVDTMAHKLMKTKAPRPSSETTWAQVIEELESRADQAHDAAEGVE